MSDLPADRRAPDADAAAAADAAADAASRAPSADAASRAPGADAAAGAAAASRAPGAAAASRAPGAASRAPEAAAASRAPTAAASPLLPVASRSPGLVARLGFAIAMPQVAHRIAADRANAGRSGTDLIAMLALVLAATQLRGLATAVWLGGAVSPGFGVRAAVRVLTTAFTVDLGLLVLGAAAVFAASGARRSLGRAFDLASVAVLPVLLVQMAATIVVQVADLSVPAAASWLLAAISYGWMGCSIALAIAPARRAARAPELPVAAVTLARRVGACVIAIAAAGAVAQTVWIAGHLERIKPMHTGDQAPAFALPEVTPAGALGERVALASTHGKVTVLDFWATWCGPCLAAMPRLEKLARSHPDVAVLTINLDDPAAARAIFNEHGYSMKLLADDGDASDRYGVSTIPHTVVIDRDGAVREVLRGAADVAGVVDSVRRDSH